MSKVKMNYTEFADVETNIQKAYESLEAAEECWGTNFDNVHHNIVETGYLNTLYEDAKSNWHVWRGTITVVAAVAGFALCLTNPVGWVAIAIGVLGAIFGVGRGIKQIANEPDWHTASKEVFENLLLNCRNGADDNYIRIANLATKFYNIKINLERFKQKLNDYNHECANFEEAADQYGLTIQTAGDDGLTVVGVETEIVVDGQKIKTTTTEAMNAFYTYQNTVMASRIEAQYLADTYGIEIDYTQLVKNANGFVVKTLNSGLYTKEFIEGVMPSYSPDSNAAADAVAGNMGMTTSDFQSAIAQAAGLVGLGAGILGASFIGEVKLPGQDDDGGGSKPVPNNPDPDDGGGYTPPSGGGGTPTYPPSSGGDNSGTNPNPSDDDNKEDDTPKNEVEIEEEYKPETELPEKVESTVEKDYDDLARREYESQDPEVIADRRESITNEVDEAFASGDFADIKAKLKEMGYSEPEINALCKDRDKLTLALMTGDQKAYMAERAIEMAKADGVENFDTRFDDPAKWSDLTDGTANSIIANMSNDPEVKEAYENLTAAESTYTETVAEAAVAVEAAVLAKTTMTDLQAKFTEKFGTSDTTKWDKESAEEYNKAVKDYNEKAKDAEDKVKKNEAAKEEYEEAKEAYDEAKVDFEKEIKEKNLADGEASGDSGNDSGSEDNSGSNNNSGGSGMIVDDGNGNSSSSTGNFSDGNDGNIYGNGNDSGNNGSSGGYIGKDGEFPGLANIPNDNGLYATENYGSDGVYRTQANVVTSDGTTREVTVTSEGANFANGNGAPATDYTPYSGSNNSGSSNASNYSGFGPSDAEMLAALQIMNEEANPR